MSIRRSLVISLTLLLFCTTFPGLLRPAIATSVRLYYYSAENCPHCREYGPLIHELAASYPSVELNEKDIWLDRSAFLEMVELTATHGDLPVATPTLFLGDDIWIGIDREKLADIERALKRCLADGCRDALTRLQPAPAAESSEPPVPEEAVIDLPLLGAWDPRNVSLPLVTLILGLLDSINPCAFFVLLLLLSLMIHAHSRLRMLTVGVIFVSFSGLIYFMFMAAWLNLFLATGGLRFITLSAGLVALGIGALNIKDYFFFHVGLSLTIPEKVKPGLYHRVRALIKSSSYPSLLGGTALLAIAANGYELLCTAGFPMVFTRILTLQELPTWQYYFYLGLYNVVYVIPLLTIVILFAVTLGAHQLSEKQGRRLKLISGVMMAIMGMVLIFYPSLLQSLIGTFVIFGAAVLCVTIILSVDAWRHR